MGDCQMLMRLLGSEYDIPMETIVDIVAFRHKQHCDGYRSDYGDWTVLANMDCQEAYAHG